MATKTGSTEETEQSIPSASDNAWHKYVEEFRSSAHEAVDWVASYLADQRKYPVLPEMRPGDLIDALPASGPDKGESFEQILKDFDSQIIPAVTHWNHPGFFAYFACTGSSPAIIAEMLSAALNTNGLHWKTSPAVAELEHVALGWLREWMGLPSDLFGIIYDTASTTSMHALVAAREFVCPEARENGSNPNLIVYTSNQAHSSIEKGAIAIGLGQKQVRKIGVDDKFRMRVDLLEAAIKKDIAAGLKPMCIVATVGTTSSTSVDPIPAIADLAERYGIWLHADLAYAGSAAILPEMREHFVGVDRAHSIVTNPHKWLLTPVDLSVFFTRHPKILRSAFSLIPEYLRTTDDPRAIHLMDYGVPLGHRFRSLKLWFLLRYFGRERLQNILRSHIAFAQEFASWVDADERFERPAPTPFSTVCFRYKGTDDENRAILVKVNHSGKVFLSHTELNGKIVLRLAVGNLGTRLEDVKLAWTLVCEAVEK